MSHTKTTQHIPVLLQEVLDMLDPKKGETYLDLTAGYGGHASEILDATRSSATLIDRDSNAIVELTSKFSSNSAVTILKGDFLHESRRLVEEQQQFDLIVVDLGVSSPHLDKADRGFSLASDGPLDMRMDESQDLTAHTVVNDYSERDLTEILREYGEEPKAKAMAKLIVESRPLESTLELAAIGKKVWPGHSRSHPSTRLFQAIRIEVNDELRQIREALPVMVSLLAPGGRMGVISFHSLEDRIVKKFFKSRTGNRYDAELKELTKRPLTASTDELVYNPRSRSAKLRVAAKNKNKKEGMGYYANSGKNKLTIL